MKLSVITMFYDKNLNYIDQWVKSVEANVKVEHEIIIVDNTTKQDLVVGDYKVVHSGGNVLQFEGRRLGVEASTGDYVWLTDADDLMLPVTKMNYSEDIVCFNFAGTKPGDENMYPCTEAYTLNYTAIADDFFFEDWKKKVKNMVWNKFFRKDFLLMVYSKLPHGLRIQFMEDTLLVMFCLVEARAIKFENEIRYLYFFESGVSCKACYDTVESLETIYMGYETAMGLFISAVPEQRRESSGIDVIPLIKGAAVYYLNKFPVVAPEIMEDYIRLLYEHFGDREFLLKALEENKITIPEERIPELKKLLNDYNCEVSI